MELTDVHGLLGRTAYAADGDRLGAVSGVYLDNATGRPSWLAVESGGLFRTTRSFVPLNDVELVDGGVRVGVDADSVKRAPHVDDDRELTPADELGLLHHYGLASPAAAGPEHAPATTQQPPPGPAPDHEPPAMTRSEERVRVGTTAVPASRAVLRTTRVVEDRTFSVPLGRDQVQVAYEPLPDPTPAPVTALPPQGSPQQQESPQQQGSPQQPSGAEGNDDGWVVLYEERLVVHTEWVPVERVRLRTVGVQGEEVVHVDLRRERIDVEHAASVPPGPADDASS